MKCENCGNDISINDKYCPHCGTLNDIAAKHVDDMNRYEQRFSDTEKDVVHKTNWFIRYITPIIVLFTSGVIFLVVISMAGAMYGYDLADNANEKYNKKNETLIDTQLRAMMDEGRYSEAYMAYSIAERRPIGEKSYSWSGYYTCLERYERARGYILSYYTNTESYVSSENNVSNAAKEIYTYYSYAANSAKYDTAEDIVAYQNKLRVDFEKFLKAYANFTDEDLNGIADMDSTEILMLLTRRMVTDATE